MARTLRSQCPSTTTAASKTWTIRASDGGSSEFLEALSIDTVGDVFVSYDHDAGGDGGTNNMGNPDSTRTIIRVSGDDQRSVDGFTVATADSHDGGGGKGDRLHL